ncbi:hypothetical protein BGZ73_000996, partial [Actinomortierella ambigua]
MAIIATAQQASVAPRPASFPSYTKHKTKLYICGGDTAGSSLFNFDTKNWTLSNAKYPNALLVAKPVTLGTDGAVFIAGGSPYAMHEYRTYSFVRDEAVLTTIPFKALKLGIP